MTTEEEKEEQKLRTDAQAEIFDGKEPDYTANPDQNTEIEANKDPLAGLDPAIAETLNGINTKLSVIDNLESRLKQTEHRIGSIQNKESEAQKALDLVSQRKLDEERVAEALKSDEKWESFQEEFPDMANAISGKITQGERTVTELRDEIKTLKSAQAEPTENLEVRLVGLVHPDWQETVNTKEYKDWLSSQSDEVKHKANHGKTADEAVSVLNDFKKSVNPAPSREDQLESFLDTKTTHKPLKPKSAADLNEQELRQDVAAEVFNE